MQSKTLDRVVSMSEVVKITGLGESTIFRRAANGTFPSQIKLGSRRSGWFESDLAEWLATRPRVHSAGWGEENQIAQEAE